jgi:acetyltransferase-like isoleucine patch superfamily enzyme
MMLRNIFFKLKCRFLLGSRFRGRVHLKNTDHIHIGCRVKIARGCSLEAGSGHIFLGDNVHINQNVSMSVDDKDSVIRIDKGVEINQGGIFLSGGEILIGENAIIGPRVTLIPYTHNFGDTSQPIKLQGRTELPITIGKNSWIGANVTILGGVTVGEGAIVGAGAVVHRDIPAFTIAAGVPAKVIKNLNRSTTDF